MYSCSQLAVWMDGRSVQTVEGLIANGALNPLQQFTYQEHMNHFIGVDLSIGMEYRPFLNNNMIVKFGIASLLPGQGFRDLFDNVDHSVRPLLAGFIEATLTY